MAGRITSVAKLNKLIWNRTRDFPACSIQTEKIKQRSGDSFSKILLMKVNYENVSAPIVGTTWSQNSYRSGKQRPTPPAQGLREPGQRTFFPKQNVTPAQYREISIRDRSRCFSSRQLLNVFTRLSGPCNRTRTSGSVAKNSGHETTKTVKRKRGCQGRQLMSVAKASRLDYQKDEFVVLSTVTDLHPRVLKTSQQLTSRAA
jgi:hypothetical protein